MFQFDWSRFNTCLGLIFAVGVLVVFGLTGRLDFPFYTAGISALLAWITIILAPGPTRRQHITGLLAFLVGGAALTALADTVAAWPGGRLVSVALVTDPTLIANATLNMISPSLQQTWHAAVERLVLGTAGLIAGFYFGWYFPQAWVGYGVALACSFLALGLLYVNFALVLCVLFFLTAYFWGTMQSDLAHQLGNEKLIGEFAGVAIAVIAIAVLTRLRRNQEATDQGGN